MIADPDLHVTTGPHGDDYVVVGVHPTVVGGESGRVARLIGGLEHSTTRPADRRDGHVRPVGGGERP